MLIPGTVLQGRYRIIRQIGGGGQALVYLAEDTNLGDLRAIKELTPDANASPQEQQAAYDQFEREARILIELNHPHLVYVWEHSRVGDNAYLVMDYIDGQTLQEIMEQSLRFLPEAAVLRWAGQLCDVLDYLHRQQPPIIFRDLKPSNVMLDRSDTVKLIDFGIVRLFQPGKKTDTLKMGTMGYAPPEQYAGKGQTDTRSDVYSLGATLHQLFTKRDPTQHPPFSFDTAPPRSLNPAISPHVEAAITKALAYDRVHRFQSVREMKRALMGAPAPTSKVTIPRPVAKRRIELRWPLLGLAAFIVVLAWFLVGRGEPGLRPTPTVAPAVVLATNTATPRPGLTASPTSTPIMPSPTPTPMPILTATPTLTPEPPTPTLAPPTAVPTRERIWEKDSSVMVYVPAGEFLMGSKEDDRDANNDEYPQHTIYVSEFWIDKTEVTNEQYGRCVAAGACWASEYADNKLFGGADQPVVGVSWYDAKNYCEWAGKRLPTEAEWEKAARGMDGRKYPWGNSFDGSKGNFSHADDGYRFTAPVGSYPEGASPYGALDMAGNVWEWCQDWYDEDYYASSPQHDPQGPSSGDDRVARGGSESGHVSHVRAADRFFRAGPDYRRISLGFRCVSLPPLLTPEPPTPTLAPPTAVSEGERIWEKDSSVMVYVPAGEFLMGSKEDDPDADDNEHPQHTVYVSEFWIDKTEVTNEQYRRCVAAVVCPASEYAGDKRFGGANQPVVGVSWYDAQNYCEWVGKRLPTEAEWEKAARGTDGRKYPWGDDFDCQRGNFLGGSCNGYRVTAPVGSFVSGASPYGTLDMAGNVGEWCQDWYDKDYYVSSPQHDPQGPNSGAFRVVRRSSWNHDERFVRAADRDWSGPDSRRSSRGFRCVSQSP